MKKDFLNKIGVISTKRKIICLVFAVMAVMWMFVIFGFSANNAKDSTVQSHTVTEFFIRLFDADFDELDQEEQQELISEYDRLVRKVAHFASYALLGFLLYYAVGSAVWLAEQKKKPMFAALPLCVVFAITDEYHQTFVDGRAGRFTDVLIDTGGALTGILFAIFAAMMFNELAIKRNKN